MHAISSLVSQCDGSVMEAGEQSTQTHKVGEGGGEEEVEEDLGGGAVAAAPDWSRA